MRVFAARNAANTRILTSVTLASSNTALPDDGVTAPKHVAAVLMSTLKLFLRQFTCASVGEKKNFDIITIINNGSSHSQGVPSRRIKNSAFDFYPIS
jgi:hypothetical protein